MKTLTISHQYKLWKGEDQLCLFSPVICLLFAVGNDSFSILLSLFQNGGTADFKCLKTYQFSE